MKIAIATGDGVSVREHFGTAARFQIWELGSGAPQLVEERHNAPACGAGWEPGAADPMQRSVDLVADCGAVVVARIGECAVTRLDELGILAFETDDPVEVVLRDLGAHPALLAKTQG
ncbi:Dinitrogenase iron-molybdenum cofactor biosynthesis protein [Rhodovastum atsumiense]|uniref:Dinitrogenase iron-molybdenum cofactor biosynthesis protein n=1 Tax=Rhodovastum atsumiense TaxID=504468 RepID=A0A5M6IKY2_9PROT|nr:NifB/NifX family molybdenum-iron cluster-binding protein [Rhodovastum atsumiense]KAA5608577.1 dinitrogenase iron-molybdenum cofactor biosynthesis protein [Rhodovastum atsumiense]CAH2598783.1 Dinitrogenase iron-molybdenum cofactor biosynthesis protein [Rhodovastum atsumiense]